jgi:hypothetical protein
LKTGTRKSLAALVGIIKLVPVAGGKNLETPLNSIGIAIPVTTSTEEYRALVENLPAGYTVKSITFGSTNLATDTLKASLKDVNPSPPRINTLTGRRTAAAHRPDPSASIRHSDAVILGN